MNTSHYNVKLIRLYHNLCIAIVNFMLGLRHGKILLLLNMVDDIIINMRTLRWILKAWDRTEGRKSPTLWR